MSASEQTILGETMPFSTNMNKNQHAILKEIAHNTETPITVVLHNIINEHVKSNKKVLKIFNPELKKLVNNL